MMRPMSLAALLCCVGTAGFMFSYTGSQRVSMADSGMTGTQTPDTHADHKFAKEAYLGNMSEVQLGQLALKQSTNEDVRKFAERMVKDHQAAQEELTKICTDKKLSLPSEQTMSNKEIYNKLAKQSGSSFDTAYINQMVYDHREDAKEFQDAIDKKLSDADLKAYATKTLAVIQEHLKMAEGLQKTLGGTAAEK